MKYQIGENIVAEGTPAEIAEFLSLRQYKVPKEAVNETEAPEIVEGRKAAEAEKEKKLAKQRAYAKKWRKAHMKGTKKKRRGNGMANDPEVEKLRRQKIGDAVRARCAARKAAEAAKLTPSPALSDAVAEMF